MMKSLLRNRIKKLTLIIVFLAMVVYLLMHITYILRTDTDEKRNLMGFYAEEDNSLDYVFIGSSTLWASINPLIIYRESGIKSYNIATSAQNPASLRYLIQEARKTQQKAKYVIDISNFMYDDFVWDEQNEGSIRRVTDGLKYSINRTLACYRLSKNRDNKEYYYFDLLKYHSEYRNMLKNIDHITFEKSNENKGYLYNDTVEAIECYWDKTNENEQKIDVIAEQELIKLLEYCRKEKLSVEFIIPLSTVFSIEKCNYIQKIVYSYGYDLIIFNNHINEMKINFLTDFYNAGHTNISGANKVSIFWANLHEKKNKTNDGEWKLLSDVMNNKMEVSLKKISERKYFGDISATYSQIDNCKIKFTNTTTHSCNVEYAWYVSEKNNDKYDCIYQEWYTNNDSFEFTANINKTYLVTAFIRLEGDQESTKYKDVLLIRYNNDEKKWETLGSNIDNEKE